jgi:hypothetical protein
MYEVEVRDGDHTGTAYVDSLDMCGAIFETAARDAVVGDRIEQLRIAKAMGDRREELTAYEQSVLAAHAQRGFSSADGLGAVSWRDELRDGAFHHHEVVLFEED